jgi:hypothetical protein
MKENPAASTQSRHDQRRSIGHSSHYSKRKGLMAELIFVAKAMSMGFAVSKPYGDREPYDLVVEDNGRVFRIQVKSVFSTTRWGYSIAAVRHSQHRPVAPYSAREIDFIAAYVVPHDAWYIVPLFEIANCTQIHLYPDGAKRNDGARFEKYREAWDLLRLGVATSTEGRGEVKKSQIKKPPHPAPRNSHAFIGSEPPKGKTANQ